MEWKAIEVVWGEGLQDRLRLRALQR